MTIRILLFIYFALLPLSVYSEEELTLDKAKLEIKRLEQENHSLKERLVDFEKQIQELKKKIKEHDLKDVSNKDLDS